ncbi:hypothetical protein IW140_005174 [Coemansia sp. RSA 1813]|nr:hypothetical protein LPJ74_003810 [Coemansia sp. RSA 1843]KAJ2089034.1 hypothetical protein IW138_003746 [Coemansia sp. RSA 986]KAJ2213473.1 hypothetical protein EV179_003792 [Coemansia sp. RSA 487]KAJ2565832.1 hypothetical protein IW140_005174 [Coemansia sp. RSA 1813]
MSATKPISSSGEKTDSATPILSWTDLNYDVKTKDGVRRVLSDISGSIYPGELVAIMGSSGAGKTTLLNVLSGRVQGGQLYGDIKFNGAKRNPHAFKRMLAYVEQDDLMHAALSVQETLTVSAKLRLPSKKYTDQEKLQRVDDVMRQLRLSHIADTNIGGHGMRGVSGGERKRVSIGIELVTDPSILVLDEPSSGLDSSSAEMVVKLTKDMSRERNLSTLMTIHQPSAEMVAQFDKLILLAQGKLVYMGPADQALRYFEQLGHPSTNPNPANFFIDMMTIDFSSSTAMSESEARVQTLVDAFTEFRRNGSRLLTHESSASAVGGDSSAASTHYSAEIDENKDSSLASSSSSAKNGGYSGSHANVIKDITHETASIMLYEAPPTNSWISETLVLLKRDWLLSIRNTSLIYGFLFQSVMMTIFMGFVFFQLKTNQASIQNRIGALFMLVIQSSFPVTLPTMTVIMAGRNVLMRERSTGTYRMSSYFFARALSFYPLVFLPLIIMFTGMYFIAHFQYDAAKFFIGFALLLTIIYASLGLAFTIAMLMNNMETAHIITPVTMATLFLFAGNMSNSNAVTPVLRWIKYICIFYYSYSGFMQNEFGGLKFTCDSNSAACYHTGEDVLSSYGLNELSIWLTIIINLALGSALYAIGYIGLRWVAKPRYLWL